MRSAFAANSAAALRDAAGRALRERARAGELIVIGATRGAADDFVRSSAEQGFLGVRAMTLGQLAAQLARQRVSQLGLVPLGRISEEALVARVVAETREKLAYFGPVAGRPGFIRSLAATLRELRLERADSARLAQTGAPGADLARLALAFQQELEQWRLADSARVYALAEETLATGGHPLAQLPMLLLDAPVRTRAERRLLEAWPAPVDAFVLAADGETRAALAPAKEQNEATGRTLDRLRQRLFATGTAEAEQPDASVAYFSAAGESLECVEIARRILKLAAAGTPFDRIAIALRAPERYQALLEDALRRAKIPGWFTRGSTRPDTAGRALLALLACAREGASATRFAEYLSLAQIPELDANGSPVRATAAWTPLADEMLAAFTSAAGGAAPAPDPGDGPLLSTPAAWERMLVDAAVIGGRQRWQRRLMGLEFEIRQQLKQLAEEDEARQETLERKLRQLRTLRAFALPLVGLLDALPKEAPWSIWIERLKELAETAIRRPDGAIELLEALRPMQSVGPVTLEEVYGVLEEHLRFTRRESEGDRYGKVFAGTPEDLRGRVFDIVFLPGLAEGIFPPKVTEDPLLLDEYRRPLGLDKRDDRVARERLQVHVAAAAAGERLIFSYPRMDVGQARPRVPSFYALELLKAAAGAMPELRAFEKAAATATPSRLGWPAPAQTADAIDETEYDLTALVPGGRGVGRYLIDVSPALARSLRTRYRRWKAQWSAVDGLVGDAATPVDLGAFSLAEKSYSPTALQAFAQCPYRFLLQAIYRLSPREEAVAIEQLDPLTRGNIFHQVQQHVIEELQAAGRLPVTRDRLTEVFDVIDRVLDDVARKQEDELAPAIERVWESEIQDMRTDLRGWARHMSAEGSDWVPVRAEMAFERVRLFGEYLVSGRIDVIERHALAGKLRITDYKTGRPPQRPVGYLGGGTILQPVVYALAAREALGEPVDYGRLFYCTQRGGYQEVEHPIDENRRQRLQVLLNGIQHSLTSAFLPAAPAKDACRNCDFRPVCGPYEELRATRKHAGRLETLEAIRQL